MKSCVLLVFMIYSVYEIEICKETAMTTKLFIQAIIKFLLGVILVGLLIFLPAGTVSYFNGWLLMGILFVPMFFAGIVMMFKNPELLKSG